MSAPTRCGVGSADGRDRHVRGCEPDGLLGRLGDLADFFRLRRFGHQVPAQRALVHTAFGSVFAVACDPRLLVLNALAIATLFLFFGPYNNLWDWRLTGEENGTSVVVRRRGWSRASIAMLMSLAVTVHLASAVLAWHQGLSGESAALLVGMAALGLLYVSPPCRLKSTVVAFWVAPLWAVLLFLQAAFACGAPARGLMVACAALVVAALQTQAELMHRVADGLGHPDGDGRLQRDLVRLRRLPVAVGLAALVMGYFRPLVLVSWVCAIVRWSALRRLDGLQVARVRSKPWHPAWCLYELVVYAALVVTT